MKTKKVQNPVQQRFQKEEENRIVKSVYPHQSITYEELNYSQLQPIPGEEDNWWDSCFESRSNRRSK
jgi:hypothetical protein